MVATVLTRMADSLDMFQSHPDADDRAEPGLRVAPCEGLLGY